MNPFRIKDAVRVLLARRLGVPEIEPALERLAKCGFAPRTIFDAGAYEGEFAKMCFRVWPGCRVACFEVQPKPLERLRSSLQTQRVQVFECLLGSLAHDKVQLNLAETASSILSETASPLETSARFPMRAIDEVVTRDFEGKPPDFLKLDVQGYELEVLKGGEQTLPQVQAVLAEVNLLDIHAGVPLLHELVEWFAARSWVVFDICGLTRRALDRALWQADFIFVPLSSPLRADKRWGA